MGILLTITMGFLFTITMGILLTITMGFLFTIVLGIQFTISREVAQLRTTTCATTVAVLGTFPPTASRNSNEPAIKSDVSQST